MRSQHVRVYHDACWDLVPDIVGMIESQAVSAITSAGLTVGTKWYAEIANVPAGYVMGVDPPVGTVVQPGSGVTMTISTGPAGAANVPVPNVGGMTQAAAQAAITAVKLVVGEVTQASSMTVPKGKVVRQNPAAGMWVLPGTGVDLVISAGPSGGIGGTGHIIWVAENRDFDYDSLPDDYEWIPWLEAVGYTVDVRRDYWTKSGRCQDRRA